MRFVFRLLGRRASPPPSHGSFYPTFAMTSLVSHDHRHGPALAVGEIDRDLGCADVLAQLGRKLALELFHDEPSGVHPADERKIDSAVGVDSDELVGELLHIDNTKSDLIAIAQDEV